MPIVKYFAFEKFRKCTLPHHPYYVQKQAATLLQEAAKVTDLVVVSQWQQDVYGLVVHRFVGRMDAFQHFDDMVVLYIRQNKLTIRALHAPRPE